MKPIYAIEISLPATVKSESVSYMGLTEDQLNFLKGLQQKADIIGFEWKGIGEFGIILAKKKK